MGSLKKAKIGKEDLQLQENTNAAETYERVSSTGPLMTFTKFPDIWGYTGAIKPGDIITRGPQRDIRAYTASSTGTATANSTAIQAAIDVGPGVVLVPPETFLYNTIVLKDDVFLIGMGYGSALETTAVPALGGEPADNYVKSINAASVNNVGLVNLRLINSGSEVGDPGDERQVYQVYFDTVTNSRIVGCWLEHGGQADNTADFVYLDTCTNVTVGNNTFKADLKSWNSITIKDSSDCKAISNEVGLGRTAGIFLQGSDDCVVQGNTITKATPQGAGIVLRDTSGSTIGPNVIKFSGTPGGYAKGIWVVSHVAADFCYYNTIVGNTITGAESGINLEWDCCYNTITGNTIKDTTGDGIYLIRASNYNTVGNNIIMVGVAEKNGIQINVYSAGSDPCLGNIISNNIAINSDAATAGINLDTNAAQENLVNGNTAKSFAKGFTEGAQASGSNYFHYNLPISCTADYEIQ